MAKPEPVELKRETTLRMAEHEILLAFNNDSGAELFDEWWSTEGEQTFDRFVEEHES